MKELVCITCPNSCRMTVEQKDRKWVASGNRCPRGQKFAGDDMSETNIFYDCPNRMEGSTGSSGASVTGDPERENI